MSSISTLTKVRLVSRSRARSPSVERTDNGKLTLDMGDSPKPCTALAESLFGPLREDDGGTWFKLRLNSPEIWEPPVVLYHCFGGAHTSVTAAAIHTGRLSRDVRPTGEDLLNGGPFDDPNSSIGQIHHFGRDRRGAAVKAAGLGSRGEHLLPVLLSLLEAAGVQRDRLYTCNTLSAAGAILRIGGYISLRLGLVAVGRPLAVFGTIRAFPRLTRFVARTEARIAPGGTPS